LVFIESFRDEALDLGMLEEELHGEKKRILLPLGHFPGEETGGNLTLNDFVAQAIVFQVRRNPKGPVNEMMIQEGQPYLKGMRHGVFVLPNNAPILQPFVPLNLE